jgi:hypothetical protein
VSPGDAAAGVARPSCQNSRGSDGLDEIAMLLDVAERLGS